MESESDVDQSKKTISDRMLLPKNGAIDPVSVHREGYVYVVSGVVNTAIGPCVVSSRYDYR